MSRNRIADGIADATHSLLLCDIDAHDVLGLVDLSDSELFASPDADGIVHAFLEISLLATN